ncbi:17005_t:CDS:2, partial [Racocetra persica]
MESRVTGREIVLAENARIQVRIYELQQKIIALNADKNELIQENTPNENLTRLNTALRIVLRNTEDKKDHYKAANIKKFEDFISNYIFSLLNNIGTLFQFDNQYMRNI